MFLCRYTSRKFSKNGLLLQPCIGKINFLNKFRLRENSAALQRLFDYGGSILSGGGSNCLASQGGSRLYGGGSRLPGLPSLGSFGSVYPQKRLLLHTTSSNNSDLKILSLHEELMCLNKSGMQSPTLWIDNPPGKHILNMKMSGNEKQIYSCFIYKTNSSAQRYVAVRLNL